MIADMLKNLIPPNTARNGFSVARQRGMSRLTLLVFSAIGGAVIYSAYNIVPFFYSYFEMHNQMLSIIGKADGLKDAEIRKRLLGFIKELDIPADPKQLKIERRSQNMRIQLNYEEVFSIPWRNDQELEIYTFPFLIDVEGAL